MFPLGDKHVDLLFQSPASASIKKSQRRKYNAIALETVCARHIFLIHSARDAVLLESLSKRQSSNAAADDNDVNALGRCHGLRYSDEQKRVWRGSLVLYPLSVNLKVQIGEVLWKLAVMSPIFAVPRLIAPECGLPV
jgi:hypothetical protein